MALYADIVTVIAPTAADAGDAVPVKAYIKNLYTAVVSIKASGTVFVDTTVHTSFAFPYANLAPGYTAEFLGGFTMPNSNVRLRVESYWYGADGNWYVDDTMEVNIALTGVLPTSDIKNFDFKAQAGTYNLGSGVPYDAPYEYKGKAQVGYLTISLGTGVYPSFFTKYTFPRKGLSFDEAADWTPGELSGAFILPATLELGQTYSIRAKLETADGKQETDTDWGAIKIAGLVPTPEFSEFAIASFIKV